MLIMLSGRETALNLRCPNCGGYSNHEKNKETDEELVGWNGKWRLIHKTRNGRLTTHKIRNRKCLSCRETFELFITPVVNIEALNDEIQNLQREVAESQAKTKNVEDENKRLLAQQEQYKQRLREISDIADESNQNNRVSGTNKDKPKPQRQVWTGSDWVLAKDLEKELPN